jgi:tetratricopeptide (TPR) repeat protein
MDLPGLFGRKKDIVTLAIDEAIELMELKEYDAAVKVLEEKALARQPEHRRALLHLGVCRMLMGEYARAEETLTPLAGRKTLDSERAAAEIALEKIRKMKMEADAGKAGGNG